MLVHKVEAVRDTVGELAEHGGNDLGQLLKTILLLLTLQFSGGCAVDFLFQLEVQLL